MILENLPAEHLCDTQILTFVEASSSKLLGIRWNAQTDLFFFCFFFVFFQKPSYTKREVLSCIA